jgi:4-hydroxy-tetrahydrodipicolinate reductase
MGRMIARCVSQREDCVIVAGIDPAAGSDLGFPVYADAAACDVPADVIIDFSHPAALEGLLAMALARKIPAVIATTGLNPEQVEKIKAAAKSIPVFFTANMSLGVNLMLELARAATRVLGADFDVEIVEKHHNQKIDAPSGTALMLADGISDAADSPMQYVYDRHSQRKKRQKNEIGLHAVRGGTIVGEHDILFAGRDEVLTISHSAMSKEVFATGAIRAALFLREQKAGLYSMKDMM